MSTLFKRILFIVILLGIAYGIYWVIDRQGADELKQDIVITTKNTVDSIKSIDTIPSSGSQEILGEPSDALIQQNIVVTDPEIRAPVVEPTPTKTITKTPTIPKKVTTSAQTTSSSSNVLFDLFK